MSQTIDARGLSCPQPVLMAMQAIKALDSGELLVMVDTEASRENVSRAVERVGWTVRSVAEKGEEFHLTLVKE